MPVNGKLRARLLDFLADIHASSDGSYNLFLVERPQEFRGLLATPHAELELLPTVPHHHARHANHDALLLNPNLAVLLAIESPAVAANVVFQMICIGVVHDAAEQLEALAALVPQARCPYNDDVESGENHIEGENAMRRSDAAGSAQVSRLCVAFHLALMGHLQH